MTTEREAIKELGLHHLFSTLIFYILPTKLLPQDIKSLSLSITSNSGQLVRSHAIESIRGADMILTRIKAVRRLSASIGEETMKNRPVLLDSYVADCIAASKLLPFSKYLVVPSSTTIEEIVHSKVNIRQTIPQKRSQHDSASSESSRTLPPLSKIKLDHPRHSGSLTPPVFERRSFHSSATNSTYSQKFLTDLITPDQFDPFPHVDLKRLESQLPLPGKPIKPKDMPSYSCQREHPLICINQPFLEILKPIIRDRDQGEIMNALAYRKASAAIKAYPTKLVSAKEVHALPGVGAKVASIFQEYLDTGTSSRTIACAQDQKLRTLLLFQTIHSIGRNTAAELYDRGCRTLDDVAKVKPGIPECQPTEEGLLLWSELSERISREEVEEIASYTSSVLENEILKGCEYTICGSYRRGKPSSSDVDIIFTHKSPDTMTDKALAALVECLRKQGNITATLTGNKVGETTRTKYHLHKVFCVMKLPGETTLRRRVDIIFADYSIYYTAVVGWTGSTIFERDIRRWAEKEKGYSFDSSGITNRVTKEEIFVDPAGGEAAVFEALGLKYIPPELRNADI